MIFGFYGRRPSRSILLCPIWCDLLSYMNCAYGYDLSPSAWKDACFVGGLRSRGLLSWFVELFRVYQHDACNACMG